MALPCGKAALGGSCMEDRRRRPTTVLGLGAQGPAPNRADPTTRTEIGEPIGLVIPDVATVALDVLKGDLPVRHRFGIDGLGPISQRKVLPGAEGAGDDVSRIRGVEADADPWSRPDMSLGVQPQEGFNDR
eukprot:1856752-Alexandrium_andersonii.AAC.1